MILVGAPPLWDQSDGKQIAALAALISAAAPAGYPVAGPLVSVFDVWPVVADQLGLVGGHELVVVVAGKGEFGVDG